MNIYRKRLQFFEKYGPFALVAGGSGGLGAAFAQALAKRGLNLILLAREKERLTETAKRISEKYSVDVISCPADLADYEKIKIILAPLKVSIGLLVYNAAFTPSGLFEDTSQEQLSLAASVNVRTPLLLTKMLSAPMIQNKKGGIILMSSLTGAQGSPKLAAYAATKAFNAILAEGLWKELKPHGVDVISCCAGPILAPGYQSSGKNKPAPGSITANDVAECTLNALGKGPVVIPGGVNKIGRFVLSRILTRKAAIELMSKKTGSLS